MRWLQADHDVFVARRGDEHAGFVERSAPDLYLAYDRGSRPLGEYPTMDAARGAVASAPDSRRTSRPVGATSLARPETSERSRRRRPRRGPRRTLESRAA